MANQQSAVYYDPKTGQLFYNQGYYAPAFGWINGNVKRVNIPTPSQNKTEQAAAPTPFTPNAITQAQLQGSSNGMTPQWMMDAYTNKIGQMGGNANLPPFAVTQSGFPGMGGKTAPAGTTGTGG
jgi:hypothetical protein